MIQPSHFFLEIFVPHSQPVQPIIEFNGPDIGLPRDSETARIVQIYLISRDQFLGNKGVSVPAVFSIQVLVCQAEGTIHSIQAQTKTLWGFNHFEIFCVGLSDGVTTPGCVCCPTHAVCYHRKPVSLFSVSSTMEAKKHFAQHIVFSSLRTAFTCEIHLFFF